MLCTNCIDVYLFFFLGKLFNYQTKVQTTHGLPQKEGATERPGWGALQQRGPLGAEQCYFHI